MKAEYLDSMGDDLAVVNAARVSFDKESEYTDEGWGELKQNDRGLIHYLASHGHFTPFTHVVVKLRETVPIFVARQRFKHTVGFSYNEVSRRYVSDLPEFYTPDVWRGRPVNAKQGSDGVVERMTFTNNVESWEADVNDIYYQHLEACEQVYNSMIKSGVAPEQARMVLPQSMYTSYIVTGSLAAWARAYKLRSDPHAQVEIQELAKQWDDIIRPIVPVSWGELIGT